MARATGLRVTEAGEIPFVGRSDELAWLRGLMRRAESAEARVGLLQGESGVGKSRLARQFVAEADAAGWQTIWTRYRGGLQPPDEPFDAGLGRQAERAGVMPARQAGEAGRAAATYVTLATELSLRRPLLVAFDDLHSADGSGLSLFLDFVAGVADVTRVHPCRLLVLAMHQPLAADHPGGAAFHRLLREPVVSSLALGGLDEPEVAELLRLGLHNPCDPQLVAAVDRATKGNPFFVLSLAAQLASQGSLVETDGLLHARLAIADLHLPASATRAALVGLEQLRPEILQLLRAASLLDDEFTIEDLAAAVGATLAPDAVDLAIDADALEERPGGFGFPHEGVRLALDSSIGPQERRAAHLRIAASLRERPGDDTERPVAIALHVLAAGGGDMHPAELGPLYESAADVAMDRFARSTALRLYEAALALSAYLDSLPGPSLGWLQCRAARANENDGNTPRARELYREAVLNLRGSSDQRAWGLSVIGWETSFTTSGEPIPGTAFEEEFAAQADANVLDVRVKLLTQRADALQLARDPRDEQIARQAVATSRDCESVEARAAAIATLGLVQMRHLDPGGALESFQAAVKETANLENAVVRGWGGARTAWPLIVLGEIDRAVEDATAALETARRAHDWAQGALSLAFLHSACLLRGRHHETAGQQADCIRMVDRSRYVQARFILDGAVAWDRLLRAEYEEALDAVSSWERVAGRLAAAPLRWLVESRWSRAGSAVRTAPDQPWRVPVRGEADFVSLGAICVSAEVAGDQAAEAVASDVYPLLESVTSGGVVFSLAPPILIARAAAMAARVLGRHRDAERYLDIAERQAREAGASTEETLVALERARLMVASGMVSPGKIRPLLASVAWRGAQAGLLGPVMAAREVADAAGISLRRGPGEDEWPDEFSATEREVIAAYGQGASPAQIADTLLLNERTVQGHLERAGRRLGITSAAEAETYVRHGAIGPGQSRRRSGPLAELTRREMEVVGLLARGMTNQQIADELVISLHTAIRHVANILEKTGAPNRTAAARLALETDGG